MKGFAVLAFAGAVAAMPAAQAVTSAIAPQETTPASCSTNYPGTFQISIVNVTKSKRTLEARKDLTITLKDGVLTDDEGRTGYIASNNQFQFDGPAQAGAIYTAGWSVCANQTLALGNSAIFYQCLSGTFYNLYDESTGDQCSQIFIDVVGGGSAVSAASDGQATAASATGAVTQITDGQLQATTATPSPVTQISDGQIQATTGKPVVSQISDGQIQATTGAVVSQISDGQIQATTGTAAVVSQISDGQIQATTGKPSAAVVTQISDGQIQATTGKPSVVTQIGDGQIQFPTAGASSGVTHGGNGTGIAVASPTVSTYAGAAAIPTMKAELFGLAAGVLAMAML
ncbi:hypothetical protein AAFC00_006447 [Neodothiora populina]|uniref:Cell wall mannoprotein PIR1-like C-terminal domain-containing protein n=1 Tax=Neodothiora populina TaxID=2781224 RepID=A0ABR3P5K4_9PEZI